ncbi:unnamed protein product [Ophioblennius macclurei]
MADYWKSQPRKFCQYCKCWIADNKPSIDFHERGKNHKENVAAKISEIKKKSVDKAKQEKRMCKQFAAMEEAAMKAYEEDLKRMERESNGLSSPAPAPAPEPAPTSAPALSQAPGNPQPKKPKKKQEKAIMKPTQPTKAQVWVEGLSDDGHTYYYNTTTGESRWEKPEGFQGFPQYGQTMSFSGSAWVEAVSPDGYTYYYNTETEESNWEKPAGFFSSEASGELPPPGTLPAWETQEVPDQSSPQLNIPKINFRKRKAESENSGKEEEEDKANDPVSTDTSQRDERETKEENEEVQIATVEPEKTEDKKPEVRIQVKKSRTINPYGAWEKIKEEKDPYANVDLQLPQVEESTLSAPTELLPEPKPKFKERIITSLGQDGGPASFRRNKTHNCKYRSIRQRDNDD